MKQRVTHFCLAMWLLGCQSDSGTTSPSPDGMGSDVDSETAPAAVPDPHRADASEPHSTPRGDAAPEPEAVNVALPELSPGDGGALRLPDASPGNSADAEASASGEDDDVEAPLMGTPADSGASFPDPDGSLDGGPDAARDGGATREAGAPLGADAALATGDAGQSCEVLCTAAGGHCVEETCVVDCSEPDSCLGVIDCPDDWPCEVTCGEGSCAGSIECPDEAGCTVACDGDDACRGGVACSGPRCEIGCHGENGCAGRIGGGATEVMIVCDGPGSCGDEVLCEAGNCDITCSGNDTCVDLVTNANVADVTCSGEGACGELTCNASTCSIRCPGSGSCDEVHCSATLVTPACN